MLDNSNVLIYPKPLLQKRGLEQASGVTEKGSGEMLDVYHHLYEIGRKVPPPTLKTVVDFNIRT